MRIKGDKGLFLGMGAVLLFTGCILFILQPLFADGQALNANAGQAGAWAMLYRYGSLGVVGLWTVCLLMPRKIVERLPDVTALILAGCVIWEAWMALNQLYGEEISNHALYRFTGTFLNPGPFSGFIAMGVPLAVHHLLVVKGRVDLLTKVQSFIAYTTLALCLLLLPAGMSRSAWIAAIVGGIAVYGMHRWVAIKGWCNTLLRSRKGVMIVGVFLFVSIGAGWGVFHLKKDSANGRLLMWKVASQAIAERPWTGYGTDGFPTAYAETQEQYFANGNGTAEEIYVAGTPEHAFNEYLTIAVKYGIGGLAITLIIGITAFVCAVHCGALGIAGALLAVGVFALSSYPLQLPDFLSAAIVLVTVPLVTRGKFSNKFSPLVACSLSLIAFVPFLYWGMTKAGIWKDRYEAVKEWQNSRTLYHMEAYNMVCEDYAPLYERMRWNPNYLFEYGRSLHQAGCHKESNKVLEEAELLCGDPMILNIQGKNYEALENFDHAAAIYQRAYHRLPNRIYPLYLEMKMCASDKCNQQERAKELAHQILETQEKIPSQAVEEMKGKAKEIISLSTH